MQLTSRFVTYDQRVTHRNTPRWLTLILAILGGFACELSFPGHDIWIMAVVSIALLGFATLRDSVPWNFLVGTVWGVAFFMPHITWAEYSTGGPLPWVALSVAEALFVGLFASVWTLTRRIPLVARNAAAATLAFATLWLGAESLRNTFPWGGLPWGRLGFSQSDSVLSNYAWLAGIPLLSWIVALLGAVLAVALLAVGQLNIWRIGLCLSAGIVLMVAPLFIPVSGKSESGSLTVGGVQGNVENPELGPDANMKVVLGNHVAGTEALAKMDGAEELDLVVWPENSSDMDPNVNEYAWTLIDGAARTVGTPLLLGTQEYPESGGRYNLSMLWEAGVGPTATYAKQRPVPFGEYIPERDFFRKLYPGVDQISTDMLAGSEPAALDVFIERLDRDVTVGPIICFEVGIDDVIHDSVKNGAEILFVQTNNSTFGPTNESIQQLAMSRLRAIETGRSVMHVSTVGVSGTYSPTGVELDRTEHFTSEQMLEVLPLRTGITPAVWLGEWPVRVVLAGSVLLLVAGLVASRQRKSTK